VVLDAALRQPLEGATTPASARNGKETTPGDPAPDE
jgi:hypothetical protein